jgi:hypothetical protein
LSVKVRFGMPLPGLSLNTFGVVPRPTTGFICVISFAVVACATNSTPAGISTLPLLWS